MSKVTTHSLMEHETYIIDMCNDLRAESSGWLFNSPLTRCRGIITGRTTFFHLLCILFTILIFLLELQGSQGTEPHRSNFNHTVLASFPVTCFVTLHPSPARLFLRHITRPTARLLRRSFGSDLQVGLSSTVGIQTKYCQLLCGPFKLCASAAAGPKHSATHFQNPLGGSQNLLLCSKQR